MKPLISIVIPIYNSEKFLQELIISIQKQNFYSFEVLLMDDGSTDNSLDLLKELVAEDVRFKIICNKNIGPMRERMQGVRLAQAEYISFIDSDDILLPNFLTSLYENINDADILVTNYIIKKSKKIYRHSNFSISDCDFGSNQFLEFILSNKLESFLWNKLFRKEILLKYEIMDNNVFLEDFRFFIESFSNIKKVRVINEFDYVYRQHNNSTTGTKTTKEKLVGLKNTYYLLDNLNQINETTKDIILKRKLNLLIYLIVNIKSSDLIDLSSIANEMINNIQKNKCFYSNGFSKYERYYLKLVSVNLTKRELNLIKFVFFLERVERNVRRRIKF